VQFQNARPKANPAMEELKCADSTCPLLPPSPRPLKARKPQADISEGGLSRSVNRNSAAGTRLTQKI